MNITIGTARAEDALSTSLARECEKERDAPDELWTLAVTHTLVEHLPRLTLPEAPLASRGPSTPLAHSGDGASASEVSLDGPLGDSESSGKSPASAACGMPAELSAEVSDERLGRLRLQVARAEGGLDIVISVADSHVKALIEADRTTLMKTLKDAGLHVATIQIAGPSRVGTALAVDRGGAERVRVGATDRQRGARQRTYPGALEEADTDSEGLDFTA